MGKDDHLVPDDGTVVCDFCNGERVRWSFAAKPQVGVPIGSIELTNGKVAPLFSDTAWVACHRCSLLVEARNVELLAHVCARVNQARRLTPESRDRVEARMLALFKRAFAVLTGEKTRFRGLEPGERNRAVHLPGPVASPEAN